MRFFIYFCLLLTNTTALSDDSDASYSFWVEPNYVDTQYSVLFNSLKITKIETDDKIYEYIPFGWMPYYVRAEVIDVYKGDLKQKEIIDILVYLSALSAQHQLEKIRSRFIISFCRSSNRIYFTSRDYLIQSPTSANVKKFEHVRKHGSDYEGSGNCDGNYPSLNPDSHN